MNLPASYVGITRVVPSYDLDKDLMRLSIDRLNVTFNSIEDSVQTTYGFEENSLADGACSFNFHNSQA